MKIFIQTFNGSWTNELMYDNSSRPHVYYFISYESGRAILEKTVRKREYDYICTIDNWVRDYI